MKKRKQNKSSRSRGLERKRGLALGRCAMCVTVSLCGVPGLGLCVFVCKLPPLPHRTLCRLPGSGCFPRMFVVREVSRAPLRLGFQSPGVDEAGWAWGSGILGCRGSGHLPTARPPPQLLAGFISRWRGLCSLISCALVWGLIVSCSCCFRGWVSLPPVGVDACAVLLAYFSSVVLLFLSPSSLLLSHPLSPRLSIKPSAGVTLELPFLFQEFWAPHGRGRRPGC